MSAELPKQPQLPTALVSCFSLTPGLFVVFKTDPLAAEACLELHRGQDSDPTAVEGEWDSPGASTLQLLTHGGQAGALQPSQALLQDAVFFREAQWGLYCVARATVFQLL